MNDMCLWAWTSEVMKEEEMKRSNVGSNIRR